MIKKPYENDFCKTCVYKKEDNHCRLLKCHCGAVIECPNHKEKK